MSSKEQRLSSIIPNAPVLPRECELIQSAAHRAASPNEQRKKLQRLQNTMAQKKESEMKQMRELEIEQVRKTAIKMREEAGEEARTKGLRKRM